MKQYLIEFEHDSKFLGYDGRGQLLITANSFEGACCKVFEWKKDMRNDNNGFQWEERFRNARNFINLTIE